MNRFLKPSAGFLILTLAIAGCATSPFSPPAKATKPAARAPVVDRSARQPPAYPAPPSRYAQSPQVEVGQLPREDPLTPLEYAPTGPGAPYPAERYPAAPAGRYAAPAPTDSDPYGSTPATGGYPSPTYPPGAAYPQPTYPAVAPTPRVAPPASPPVAPRAPRPVEPELEEETVALAPPVEADLAPATPPVAPRPVAPPPRPADLPPAEITRDGNQAVVALLDSADKYVKGGQLDKAGAALERALRIEPRNAGIWHDLAQIRLHQGQYQQAESLASKSNNLASGNRALQSRNWKLISVARKAGGNSAGAEEAEAQASLLSR